MGGCFVEPDLSEFVVQMSRKRKVSNALSPLAALVTVLVFNWYRDVYGGGMILGLIVGWGICAGVKILYDSRWKVTVSGYDIQVETLWSKRDFTKITSVVPMRTRNRFAELFFQNRLKLYDGSGLAIPVFRDCVGYQELIARLKETGVPGTEAL